MNPYLIAPVVVAFDYDFYSSPMTATRTASGYAVDVPAEMHGSLQLAPLNGTAANLGVDNSTGMYPEEYILRRIEIRKPGRQPPGSSQVLKRDFEVLLTHEAAIESGRWLSVILPFSVSDKHGSILSMIDGSFLPTIETETTVLQNNMGVDLNTAFNDATFLTFWDMLPTSCAPPSKRSGPDAHARILMRSASLPVHQSVYEQLYAVLNHVQTPLAVDVRKSIWTMPTCPLLDGCKDVTVPDMASLSELGHAQTLLTQAVEEVRERQNLSEKARVAMVECASYMKLHSEIGLDCRDGNYSEYSAAMEDLHAAQDEMLQCNMRVSSLEQHIASANNTYWDEGAPPYPDWILEEANISIVANTTPAPSEAVFLAEGGLLVLHGEEHGEFMDLSSEQDCSVLQRSPVDISTAANANPTTVLGENMRPLEFRFSEGASLQVTNLGTRLRVVRPRDGRQQLGHMVVNGFPQEISYVEIYSPGQHALDGSVSAAELQLVHVPDDEQKAVTAVAVRLAVSEEAADNEWLESLLSSGLHASATDSRQMEQSQEVYFPTLGSLHKSLKVGRVDKFYSYTGTLTGPPCRPATWFVFEEPGRISRRQWQALASMRSKPIHRSIFKAHEVSVGPGTVRGRVGRKRLWHGKGSRPALRGGIKLRI